MSHLTVGEPAPWFRLPSTSNPSFNFDTVGGYRVILSFLGSSKVDCCREVLRQFLALQSELKQANIPFFGVLIDPDDLPLQEQITDLTYCKLFWDFERSVSQLYGVCQPGTSGTDVQYMPTSFVLNQNLQIVAIASIQDPTQHVAQLLQLAQALPEFPPPTLATRQAPALFIPHVLSPDLCQQLIQLYEAQGSRDSGFMRQVDGKTVEIFDYKFKKRRDFLIEDPKLLQQINHLILRRVKPEIEKAFQFSISRFERHLVACYEATDQGFFRRHRDNTTKGTAHRRFAMTLNLNTGEYEGGCLWFPEYGSQYYRPNVGEAVIFSCSLLHEVTPVTQGRRFALLSFFYNDDDARIREQNRKYVVLNGDENQPDVAESPSDQTKSGAGFQPKGGKKKKR